MKALIKMIPVALVVLSACTTGSKKEIDVFALDPSFQKTSNAGSDRRPTSVKDSWSPPDSDFNDIAAYAEEKHFMGYDILACYSEDHKLKLAGSGLWGGSNGYTLFLNYAGGRMDLGLFKRMSEPLSKTSTYTNHGLLLTLVQRDGRRGGYSVFDAQIFNSRDMGSEILSCFQRNSGLE